jgi:hypothetical protein
MKHPRENHGPVVGFVPVCSERLGVTVGATLDGAG